MDNNEKEVSPVPEIPESEMKLPEEHFNGSGAAENKSSLPINPLLIVLLLVLLAILAVVMLWGEELMNMFLKPEPVEESQMMSNEAPVVDESSTQDLENIESEAQAMDQELSDIDNELDTIEAELDAELESETGAGAQ